VIEPSCNIFEEDLCKKVFTLQVRMVKDEFMDSELPWILHFVF